MVVKSLNNDPKTEYRPPPDPSDPKCSDHLLEDVEYGINRDGLIDPSKFIDLTEEKQKRGTEETTIVPIDESSGNDNNKLTITDFLCPAIIPTLIVAVIGVTHIITAAPSTTCGEKDGQAAWLCSPLAYLPKRRHEAWRFFTASLVHTDATHLIDNVLGVALFGYTLGWDYPWWKVLLIYLVGVVGGTLGHSVFNKDAILVGCSTGVMALGAGHVVDALLIDWMDYRQGKWNLLCRGNKERCMALASIARKLLPLMAMFGQVFADIDDWIIGDTQTSLVSHVCGFCSGLLISGMVLTPRKQERDILIKSRIVCSGLLLGAFVVGIWKNCFAKDFPDVDPWDVGSYEVACCVTN